MSSGEGRYKGCAELTRVERDGRIVRYLAPRILPPGSTVARGAPSAVAAEEVDRLDLFTQRRLGNPLLAHRVCDANDAMDPLRLCRPAGRLLRLPGSAL
ncbi:MAG TPA: hypothetical protein VMU32_12080 [Solirubrobacteraceae bacterium]|jgi:hypothetical protein|nr:hypothetical protein [Solirubrobacteraceae bacterium]